MKFKRFILLSLILPTNLIWASEGRRDGDVANSLLSYLGKGCTIDGEWTNAALAQAEAIAKSLELAINDPDCQSMASAVGSLNRVRNLIYEYENSELDMQIAELENKEQVLLNALDSSTAVASRDQILYELRQVQVDLAALRGRESVSRGNSAIDKKSRVLSTLVTTTQGLLGQAANSPQCWQKDHTILPAIGQLATSVFAAAQPAAVALPLVAGVELTGQVLEYLRVRKISKAVHNISDTNKKSKALHCTIESLTNHFCAAREAQKAIILKADKHENSGVGRAEWDALEILDEDLALFLNWLEDVRSGAEPTSPAEANSKQKALNRETFVRSARLGGLGAIKEKTTVRAYEAAVNNPEERFNVLKKLSIAILRNLTYYDCNGSCGETILEEVHPASVAGYFLMGITNPTDIPVKGNGTIPFKDITYGEFISKGAAVPTLSDVETRFNEWIAAGTAIVRAEMSTVFISDPALILSRAYDLDKIINVPAGRERSPSIALSRIIAFYGNELSGNVEVPKEYIGVHQETLVLLQKIREYLDQGVDPNSPLPPAGAFEKIYEVAKLEFGSAFLAARIERALKYRISILIATDPDVDAELAARLLAASSVVAQLQGFVGSSKGKDLQSLQADVVGSQSASLKIMIRFGQYFSKDIKEAITTEETTAKLLKQGPDGPNRQMVNALCVKLLTLPIWPKEIPHSFCLGAQLKSVYPKGPPSVVVTEETLALPYEERVCLFRKFMTDNALYGMFH